MTRDAQENFVAEILKQPQAAKLGVDGNQAKREPELGCKEILDAARKAGGIGGVTSAPVSVKDVSGSEQPGATTASVSCRNAEPDAQLVSRVSGNWKISEPGCIN
jgi:hypothetical protein